MIDFNKGHYLDIEGRREFYRKAIGEPPSDGNIYNYYLNMIDAAIQSGAADNDFNRSKFPHSVRAKQEMIKIIMIIQADARKPGFEDIAEPVTKETPKKKLFKWRSK